MIYFYFTIIRANFPSNVSFLVKRIEELTIANCVFSMSSVDNFTLDF